MYNSQVTTHNPPHSLNNRHKGVSRSPVALADHVDGPAEVGRRLGAHLALVVRQHGVQVLVQRAQHEGVPPRLLLGQLDDLRI